MRENIRQGRRHHPPMIWLIGWTISFLFTPGASGAENHGRPAELWFRISLHSGSVLTVQIPEADLTWTDLSVPGKMVQRSLPLREIQQAVLGKEPVGSQVTQVRQYLTYLRSDDFAARELAEKELARPELGGRFRSLIEAEKSHPQLEVRYRIQRILDELAKVDFEVTGAFDRIQLKGETKEVWHNGDLGDLMINCRYRGQALRLDRSQVELMTAIVEPPGRQQEIAPPRPVEVDVAQRFDRSWAGEPTNFIDFQMSPTGQLLLTKADVSALYVPLGLRMDSGRPGYIGISGYAFRADCPPKENSICVFEVLGSTFQRFKGVMEFRFCLPNQQSVAAGVYEFSLFVSRVNKPRDFILEAYNAEEQLLGTVEASDANCTFHGIRSTEPIAKLRLLSNPYLFNINRAVDDDFCVDDVRFSPPVALPYLRASQKLGVMTHDGDRLIGAHRIEGDNLIVALENSDRKVNLALHEIRSIKLENEFSPIVKGQRVWFAMLADRSIVQVEPGKGFLTPWFNQRKLNPNEIVAIWLAPNQLRFPLAIDHQDSRNLGGVMVFPTGRVLAEDVLLDQAGYRWSKSQRREQDLWVRLGEEGPATEIDPTPQLTEINFAETSAELVPTLWRQKPPQWQPGLGLIRLTDGQQFAIGGATGIELESVNPASVTLRWQGATEEIKFASILSIDFAAAGN